MVGTHSASSFSNNLLGACHGGEGERTDCNGCPNGPRGSSNSSKDRGLRLNSSSGTSRWLLRSQKDMYEHPPLTLPRLLLPPFWISPVTSTTAVAELFRADASWSLSSRASLSRASQAEGAATALSRPQRWRHFFLLLPLVGARRVHSRLLASGLWRGGWCVECDTPVTPLLIGTWEARA